MGSDQPCLRAVHLEIVGRGIQDKMSENQMLADICSGCIWYQLPLPALRLQMVGQVIQDKMDKKLRQAAHQSTLMAAVAAQQQAQAQLASGGVVQPLARAQGVCPYPRPILRDQCALPSTHHLGLAPATTCGGRLLAWAYPPSAASCPGVCQALAPSPSAWSPAHA